MLIYKNVKNKNQAYVINLVLNDLKVFVILFLPELWLRQVRYRRFFAG